MRTPAGNRLLILSDGKPGHLNQSIAFARLLGCDYQICRVAFANGFAKMLSYLYDRVGLHSSALFRLLDPLPDDASAVISAGSATYYANRTIGKSLSLPTVAIMFPSGFRLGFDLIIAQEHDAPPHRDNIVTIPLNLSAPQPQGLVCKVGRGPTVALIIGGPSRHFSMEAEPIRQQLEKIYSLFPDGDFIVTTSRRTPAEVERLIEAGPFRYRVIASKEQINPIADFLAISDHVFVTEDSTSMISEAVSFGTAAIELIPLAGTGTRNKIGSMTSSLEAAGYLHRFDGTVGNCRRKFELDKLVKSLRPRIGLG